MQFFFVLSGFIICYSTYKSHGKPALVGNYFLKRFIRVYLPYWLVILFLFVSYQAFPSSGEDRHRDLSYFISSFTLLPHAKGQYLGVAWTLVYEVIFYIIFAFVLLHRKLIYPVVVLLLVMGFARLFDEGLAFLRPNPNWALFALGIGCSLLVRKYNFQSIAKYLLGIGLLGYTYAALHHVSVNEQNLIPDYDWSVFRYGLSSAFIIIGASYSNLRIGKTLGDMSYGLYLTHIPAMGITSALLKKTGFNIFFDPLFAFTLLSIICIAVGLIFSKFLELPLVHFFKKKLEA